MYVYCSVFKFNRQKSFWNTWVYWLISDGCLFCESFCKARGRDIGKLTETCLSGDEEIHTWVTEMILSPVVYGKFSLWLGRDFVAGFVWITKLYITAIIFPCYLKSNLSFTLTHTTNHKCKMKLLASQDNLPITPSVTV